MANITGLLYPDSRDVEKIANAVLRLAFLGELSLSLMTGNRDFTPVLTEPAQQFVSENYPELREKHENINAIPMHVWARVLDDMFRQDADRSLAGISVIPEALGCFVRGEVMGEAYLHCETCDLFEPVQGCNLDYLEDLSCCLCHGTVNLIPQDVVDAMPSRLSPYHGFHGVCGRCHTTTKLDMANDEQGFYVDCRFCDGSVYMSNPYSKKTTA